MILHTPDLTIDLLLDYKKPEDLIGEHGLLKQLTKALVERALQADYRGVQDIFIACDGLKGFPEAIETVYSRAIVQL
ncbi:hypothetical protein SAMN05216333_1771, partial [Nitrosomonas oligotropha]